MQKKIEDEQGDAALTIKKIANSLNSSVFFDRVPELQVIFKAEKRLSFRFENQFLFFGFSAFELSNTEILISIFHEMVHALNSKKGLKDVGRNCYHNKHFLQECLCRGLFVVKHRNQGWSLVSHEHPRNVTEQGSVRSPSLSSLSTSRKAFAVISDEVDWESFYSNKKFFSKSKDYSYKYVCSCPPPFNSIRSGRGPSSLNPLNLRCEDCGQVLVCEPG